MRLQVRGVDHDPVWFPGLPGQFDKDAVEHTQPAPADEAVVDRLVRAIGSGCIAPPQTVLDDEDDRGHYQPVINAWNSMRSREKWLDPAHLHLTQHKQIVHKQHLLVPPLNQPSAHHASNLTGPDPSIHMILVWFGDLKFAPFLAD